MPPVAGLDSPSEFYWVLQKPAPLAGMAFPQGNPWKFLASVGFKSVVCLTDNTLPYDPSPLEVLRSLRFKDLYGNRYPNDPTREADALRDVVKAIVNDLHSRRGVAVHCAGGTGRTGTVIACTLRVLGVSTDEVLKYTVIRRIGVALKVRSSPMSALAYNQPVR